MTDFFISYTAADRKWAEWIAWTLEEAGHTTTIQAWDFRPGGNFVVDMQKAAARSERTLAVLSPDYLRSLYATAEWAAAFAADPDGAQRKLVPVLVREATLDGLLAPIIHIKLVGLLEAPAREALIDGLKIWRAKPASPPSFPGARPFPGPATAPSDAEAALDALPVDEVPLPGPLPAGSRMPFSHNPLFVGREEDLKELARQLKAGGTSAVGQVEIAAATGLGGIGKTQLASEFVHRYGRFFAGGVFWLSFADAAAVPIEVADCGRSLNLLSHFDALPLEQQVRLAEEAWRDPLPRLLVFDNCEEEELLRRWRPPFGSARVLVTSRRPEWDPALGVKTVPLTTLPRPASIELLRLFRPDVPETEPALNDIADELGDLPLALHLAGKFLDKYRASPHGRPAVYLKALQQRDLLDHPSFQGHDSVHLPTEHANHVGRTFALSFERLDPANSVDALASEFLARAAWFAPGEPIPRSLLLETASKAGEDLKDALLAEDALHRLTDLGLLERNDRNDLLMHRLVAVWARGVAESSAAREAVEEVVLKEATRLNETRNPALLMPWQPHLRAVTDLALKREDRMAARLCDELGEHLWHAGDYSAAQPYSLKAVDLHTKTFGEEHLETAESLNNLGRLFYRLDKLPKARSCFKQSLHIREKLLGLEHPDTAHCLQNLGVVLQWEGDFKGAHDYQFKALAIREKVLGPEHRDTAFSLHNLGTLFFGQNDFETARTYYERALATREKVLGPEHPEVARTLDKLGQLLQSQGNLEQARACYERSLAIREKELGSEHPDTGLSLRSLGSLYLNEGNPDLARPYLERALSIFTDRIGSDHSTTERVLSLLSAARRPKKQRSKKSA
ncbi:MAG TPA: tetratricopeptide repeat protein [Thermoanaerobaculia bacterium]|nr:tetratricopeptide repeat protein [Thermoanaerobaculia bacterium]